MELSELANSNEILGDPRALADRYDKDGCLLVRRALTSADISEIAEQATAVLERWGVATVGGQVPGLRWTGQPLVFLDIEELHRVPALGRFIDDFGDPGSPLRSLFDQLCGHPMHLRRNAYFHTVIPDDPACVTPPHQDAYAMTATGDYRRAWIALTHTPFADGGLAVALGSHRAGRFPTRQLPELKRRATIYNMDPDGPVWGVDPELLGDHWHTTTFEPGDAVIFSSELLHRGLAPVSDRIRIALAVMAQAATDPRPAVTFTTVEDVQRQRQLAAIANSLGLSDEEIRVTRIALTTGGLEVNEATVRAAVASELTRWRSCRGRGWPDR